MLNEHNPQKQPILYDHRFSQKGVTDFWGRKHFHYGKIISLLNPQPKEKILDIGCNRGELVAELRELCPETDITGCDINADAIATASVSGLAVMQADNLKYPENTFDKIVSSHTLEHVPDFSGALEEMKRAILARKFHLHRLTPNRIKKSTSMRVIKSGLFYGPYPTHYTVLQK
ncbi:MAG: SAM binding domain-containing protein [Parcubacteria group bacterium GW2011_GWA2_40_8]|nr:MAG: SAM binding domain-containing protein [Parcubacteria group bacterium GW2011_GWA2_40_8]